MGKEFKRIIAAKRSIIVAADVSDLGRLKDLVSATIDVPEISGYKLGFTLAFTDLGEATKIICRMSEDVGKDPVIIYDHQKAGNDIPDVGSEFAKGLVCAGINTAILFPFAGPVTQEAWTKACFEAGLNLLTGGVMTHPKFLRSEGGYIADEAVLEIYTLAAKLGDKHFVVPGTKIHWVRKIKEHLDAILGVGGYVLYAPGFISQGGDISECAAAAGDEWHAIVGSAIYKKETVEGMRQAALLVTKQIAGSAIETAEGIATVS